MTEATLSELRAGILAYCEEPRSEKDLHRAYDDQTTILMDILRGLAKDGKLVLVGGDRWMSAAAYRKAAAGGSDE